MGVGEERNGKEKLVIKAEQGMTVNKKEEKLGEEGSRAADKKSRECRWRGRDLSGWRLSYPLRLQASQ
jgi:hypothetical protein